MRRFLIIVGVCFLALIGVFIYASTQRGKAIVVTVNDFSSSTQGQVLSAKTESQPTIAQTLPVKITITKKTVLLYWPQQITVETSPKAEVRLEVTYPNGSINNNGTQIGVADGSGKFIVKWTIDGQKITGVATASATATLGGRQGSSETQFEIKYNSSNNKPPPTPTPNPH